MIRGDEEYFCKPDREHRRDDVEVRHQRRLQNDGDVRRVEELDGVRGVLAAVPGGHLRINRFLALNPFTNYE